MHSVKKVQKVGEKKSLTVSSKRGLASRVWLQWHLLLLAEWSSCSWVAIQCCAYYPKATSFCFKEERCHKLTLIHGKVGYGNLRLVKSHLTMNTQTEDTKAGEDDIAWGRSCSNWIGYSLTSRRFTTSTKFTICSQDLLWYPSRYEEKHASRRLWLSKSSINCQSISVENPRRTCNMV